MYCVRCGASNVEEARFCRVCGAGIPPSLVGATPPPTPVTLPRQEALRSRATPPPAPETLPGTAVLPQHAAPAAPQLAAPAPSAPVRGSAGLLSLGLAGLVLGFLLIVANLLLPGIEFARDRFPDGPERTRAVAALLASLAAAGATSVLGLLLVLGRRVEGRWTKVLSASVWPVLALAGLLAGVSFALVEREGDLAALYYASLAGGIFLPLHALAAVFVLLRGARGGSEVGPPEGGTRPSLAFTSFVLSLVPLAGATQLVALPMGIAALVSSSRPGGDLSGRGFAATAVGVSLVVLVLVLSFVFFLLPGSEAHR